MDVVDGVNSGADQQFRALDAGKVGAEDVGARRRGDEVGALRQRVGLGVRAVLEREVRAADAPDAGTGLGKLLRVPGALGGTVVAGRNHLAVADDDATDFSTEAGRAQRRREGEDHGIGGLVGSTLLFDAVGFDGVRVGSGPAGAARRWPGGPGGHRSMLPRPISLPVWGRVTEPALASSP